MSKSLRHFLDINELPTGELRNMLAAGAAMKANSRRRRSRAARCKSRSTARRWR